MFQLLCWKTNYVYEEVMKMILNVHFGRTKAVMREEHEGKEEQE